MDDLLNVYIHIDMDAYYAQAESKLLNIDPDKPLCARQWNSLIAVNYAARDYGIERGMLTEEAERLCPHVCTLFFNINKVLPHVETFKLIDGKMVFSTISEKFGYHSQYEEKVSLQYYRQESKKIFQVVRQFCSVVKKGGIDEAYLQIRRREIQNFNSDEFIGNLIIKQPQGYCLSEHDRMIMYASQLCQKIRDAIYTQLKYKCSAGISINKMLAKLASSVYKPNQQTIILQYMLPDCLRNIKIGKIRGFGGKIKDTFIKMNIKTVGEAQDISKQVLEKEFPFQADQVYAKLRGVDVEDVKQEIDFKNKSINSLKNIKKTNSREKVIQSIELISFDIAFRIIDFYEDNKLIPTVISIVYHNTEKGQHSKQDQLRLFLPVESFRDSIYEKAMEIFNTITDDELFPTVHIGISTRYFKPVENIIDIKKYIQQQPSQQSQGISQNPMDIQTYECQLCKKSINVQYKNQHDDFHYAEELDKTVNPKKRRCIIQSSTPKKQPSIMQFLNKK